MSSYLILDIDPEENLLKPAVALDIVLRDFYDCLELWSIIKFEEWPPKVWEDVAGTNEPVWWTDGLYLVDPLCILELLCIELVKLILGLEISILGGLLDFLD